MRKKLSWNQDQMMAHGGFTFTLADTVGGAALVSLVAQPVPTSDMRIDYLEAGTGDLHAEADVVREGGYVRVIDVAVVADGNAGGRHSRRVQDGVRSYSSRLKD